MASNDTYSGALEVLANQLSSMMGLTDANLPFVMQLLEQVTAERRSPELAMQQAGVIPPAQSNPAGAENLGLPIGGGASAPPPSMLGAGVPGVPTAPPPVNPDELRRILTAQ